MLTLFLFSSILSLLNKQLEIEMKISINIHYILMFSYELRKDVWELEEHEYYITAHNVCEDMQIIIPKQLDEFNKIDLWCSGTLLDSFGTITMLDMHLKEILK